jgi:hypothetical protein
MDGAGKTAAGMKVPAAVVFGSVGFGGNLAVNSWR